MHVSVRSAACQDFDAEKAVPTMMEEAQGVRGRGGICIRLHALPPRDSWSFDRSGFPDPSTWANAKTCSLQGTQTRCDK